jgi:SAM-dependent methyltransferase
LPQVFDAHQRSWEPVRAELAGLLTEQEYAAARASTVNAHYTSAEIVQEMWKLVADHGFTGGRVLEPGCGSGNFLAFAPVGTQLVGVKAGPVTGRIARALYPDAEIRIEWFERTRLPAASFDLAIGNVLFGDIRLHDAVHNRGNHPIHNHFIVKAVALTRPGGLVVVVTSRYTLDARNPAARRELAGAGLLGAVRLPSDVLRIADDDPLARCTVLQALLPGIATMSRKVKKVGWCHPGSAWTNIRELGQNCYQLPGNASRCWRARIWWCSTKRATPRLRGCHRSRQPVRASGCC